MIGGRTAARQSNVIIDISRGFWLRVGAVVLGVCSLVPLAGFARADLGDSPEVEAQRLVHVLGYVAGDYGGAVQNGAVVAPSEYAEQLALLDEAGRIAVKLAAAPHADSADVVAEVGAVRALVEKKALEGEVEARAKAARSSIAALYRLSESPPSPPDAARGEALFKQNCVDCHGSTGKGDGPKAAELTPKPASFHNPDVADALSPYRVFTTVRFGISGTAMVPFTALSDRDRWDIAFYVLGLRHGVSPASDAPLYALSELAARTDAELARDLGSAHVGAERLPSVLADLRRHAPYENRVAQHPLLLARAKLDRARTLVERGDRDAARAEVIDAYLEGVEPAEGALRTADTAIARSLEDRFSAVRGKLSSASDRASTGAEIDALLAEITRAEAVLGSDGTSKSFASTALSSAGIFLREGVEAALLVAALLGLAAQAGLSDKRRWVHLGWSVAILLGFVTWFVSSRLVAISGARRELVEGVTAMLAVGVLFYVSYSLLAKREVARWLRFLREQVSPARAAFSLFGVAFLAAYREAFETVLFYQALLASNASVGGALVGAAGGGLVLVGVVFAYTRAGRFAPPQVFFKISSWLLYALAVAFAGQGISALQVVGLVSLHTLALPKIPLLGIFPTVETYAVQSALVLAAAFAAVVSRRSMPRTETRKPEAGAAA